MKLLEMQRLMAADVMRPLGGLDKTRAATYIKPNDRLTSLQRLEIYNKQYWFRLVDSLYDDYPGLLAVLGTRSFSKLAFAYIRDCPSRSFSLRDLGQSLEAWLRANPTYAADRHGLALDMAKLEWAHVESFDGAEAKALGPEDLAELDSSMSLSLQPHIRLLELQYPVDDLRVRFGHGGGHDAAGNASEERLPKFSARIAKRLKPAQVFLATHRVDGDVYYRRLEAGEFELLRTISAGASLVTVLESAAQYQDSLERWFAAWAQLGWLCRSDRKNRKRKSNAPVVQKS